MATELSEDQRIALTRQLAELRDRNHTVADFGRAVLDFALSDAATAGSLTDGVLEIPLTITLRVPPSSNDAEAPLTCVEACVKGGGTKRLCAWVCNPAPVIEPRTIQ